MRCLMGIKKVAIITISAELAAGVQQPMMLWLPPELLMMPRESFRVLNAKCGFQLESLKGDPIRYKLFLNAQDTPHLGKCVAQVAMYVRDIFGVSLIIQRCKQVDDVLKLCA